MIVVFWIVLALGLLATARALWPSAGQRAHGFPNHTQNGKHQ